MNINSFRFLVSALALGFTVFFVLTIIPPLIADPNIFAALAAGFVNPYAAGYSTDVILCWFVLLVWIIYEAKKDSIKHGWLCLVLGLFPGVVVGFALYLILREKQIDTATNIVSV